MMNKNMGEKGRTPSVSANVTPSSKKVFLAVTTCRSFVRRLETEISLVRIEQFHRRFWEHDARLSRLP